MVDHGRSLALPFSQQTWAEDRSGSAIGATPGDTHDWARTRRSRCVSLPHMAEQPRSSKAGRRRDPEVSRRIRDAALEVYADYGWGGFTFEAIARHAGIGKPAIYLRWKRREDLLFEALDLSDVPPFAQDTGSLKGDLVAFGISIHQWWRSRAGTAWLQLQLDQERNAELTRTHVGVVRRNVAAASSLVELALSRGELDSFDDGILLLEIVNGSVLTRISMTRPDRRDALDRDPSAYVARVVDRLRLS